MLFLNGIDLYSRIYHYISSSRRIHIFSAYIKLQTLQSLIDERENIDAVFVRWEPRDLIYGSSDLEIYPYLKSKGIALYRNPRLHLKAYIDDYKSCFLTSANISSRALNVPPYSLHF